MRSPLFWTVAAFSWPLLSSCAEQNPPHIPYSVEYPPPMEDDVNDLLSRIAKKRDFHLHEQNFNHFIKSREGGLRGFSLWLLRNEADRMWIVSLGGRSTQVTYDIVKRRGLSSKTLDELEVEINEGFKKLGLAPCRKDVVLSVCSWAAKPRTLYQMDFDRGGLEGISTRGEPERPGPAPYDAARRHGVRIVSISPDVLERKAGRKGLYEYRYYRDLRARHRGEHMLVLTNAPADRRVRLLVFEDAAMPADALEDLVQDMKTTLEVKFGLPFKRADPATGEPGVALAADEQDREAWLRARAGGRQA